MNVLDEVTPVTSLEYERSWWRLLQELLLSMSVLTKVTPVTRPEHHMCYLHFYIFLFYDDFIWFIVFNATFSNISTTSWRPVFSGGRSRSTLREPPTMGKQLANFINCGCESSASFFVIYKAGREPTPYWW